MQKLMWFLVPRDAARPSWEAWRALARITAPKGVRNWRRSQGIIRGSSLLDGSPSPPGAPIALEEFSLDAEAASDVRAWLLDDHRGLAAGLVSDFDFARSHLVLTDEIPVIRGPRTLGAGRTTMALYARRPDQSRQDSQAHWLTTHADMVRRRGGMTHYTQCPVVDPTSPFDGVPIIHFADPALEATFLANAAALAEQLEDSRLFIDHARTLRFSFSGQEHEGDVHAS